MTDDTEERRSDNPREWTYRDYHDSVGANVDAAEEALTEYPEDWETIHDVVTYAIDGDRFLHQGGFSLVTVLMSDQNPDRPDYTERWQSFVDFDADPTWSDVLQQMAYACLYSDVLNRLQPPDPLIFDSDGGVVSLRCKECDRSVMYADRNQHSCVDEY